MSSLVHGPLVGAFPGHVTSEIGVPLLAAPHAGASSPLPTGFPAKLSGELAWSGSDFWNDDSYIYRLTAKDMEEISSALDHFKGEETRTRPAKCSRERHQLINCHARSGAGRGPYVTRHIPPA